MPEPITDALRREVEALLSALHRVSPELGEQVDLILRDGWANPLSPDELTQLLTTVITVVQAGARQRNGTTAQALQEDVEIIVRGLAEARECVQRPPRDLTMPTAATAPLPPATPDRLVLQSRNNVTAGALHPTPLFHGRRIPVDHGYVKVSDLGLWDHNDRLDIHLRQFQQQHGRRPNRTELLDIMLNRMPLPGVERGDQFKIVELANSIAVNGVRKPPILDLDGTPLDGNRRLAACSYILNNTADFNDEERQRVEYIYVWQLTQHATDEDRRNVVVSLNFESDCKIEWPAYVKARKIYEEWQAMCLREPRAGVGRQRDMLVELSKRYALGPDTTTVKRYLKMVNLADEFTDFHVNGRDRDRFEVEHQANRYFEYFDELSKGSRAGGVEHTLNQNPDYKNLVYDLLFQGKFKNFTLIRDLKYLDDGVKESLTRAHEMPYADEDDLEEAQDLVERTLVDARNRNRVNRVGNADSRIEQFVRWLEGVPISTLRTEVRPENREKLHDALRIAVSVMDYRRPNGGNG